MARRQPVRGMRDLLPPAPEVRAAVAARILGVYRSFGYESIETPALESLDVLTGSQGGDNEKHIFKVLKRGAKLDRELAGGQELAGGEESVGGEELAGGGELADLGLRFDLTVPLGRFVASHAGELPLPLKVAHLGPVWRAERPQRGRYRQFTQCDIDIVGEPGVAAEVELCQATLGALDALGLAGCTVRINDRRLLRALVTAHLGEGADVGAVYVALDKLDKVSPDEVVAELAAHDAGAARALVDQLVGLGAGGPPAQLGSLRGLVGRERGAELDDLERTLDALPAGRVRLDPALVRGMGYYTGQVFEVEHPDVPYSLAGGGRYDGMTARFGAPSLPACGFSIGFERVCDLVDAAALLPARRKVAVLCGSDDELVEALGRGAPLRAAGAAVTVVRRARNVRKQTEDLARLGYREVLGYRELLEAAALPPGGRPPGGAAASR